MPEIKIGDRLVGDGHPTYIIAEIGVNHNGILDYAFRLIDASVAAGADAVKFQKRTPIKAVPPEYHRQQARWPRIEPPFGNDRPRNT